jgi:hypothetical protein
MLSEGRSKHEQILVTLTDLMLGTVMNRPASHVRMNNNRASGRAELFRKVRECRRPGSCGGRETCDAIVGMRRNLELSLYAETVLLAE